MDYIDIETVTYKHDKNGGVKEVVTVFTHEETHNEILECAKHAHDAVVEISPESQGWITQPDGYLEGPLTRLYKPRHHPAEWTTNKENA